MKTKPHTLAIWLASLVLFTLLAVAIAAFAPPRTNNARLEPTASAQPATTSPIPVLAYYYIWYSPSSWERAKSDLPLLGAYSSDDILVMRQHILDAKAAGINGFIVSWKSTETLNRRLTQLAEVSQEENFRLVIIYQGLDFERNPLPINQVANDMDVFIRDYASMPAFQLFSKPLVIWSGTWKFSTQEVQQVTDGRRQALLILASERNLEGYARLASLVDGDAYYWSSVNPETYPGYPNKLVQMGQAIHANNGLWIAPAAPGFDARAIGGTTVVDRKDGDTFRTELNTAFASSPDAIGIISWNEFSENSHIEPSQTYGTRYLDILKQVELTPSPNVVEFDSSIPDRIYPEVLRGSRLVALGGLASLLLISLFVILSRR